jgi:hypothetical protein
MDTNQSPDDCSLIDDSNLSLAYPSSRVEATTSTTNHRVPHEDETPPDPPMQEQNIIWNVLMYSCACFRPSRNASSDPKRMRSYASGFMSKSQEFLPRTAP